ncbi:hypothetical protein BH23GEM9_BH23GEM9_24850 [soil metagenome]
MTLRSHRAVLLVVFCLMAVAGCRADAPSLAAADVADDESPAELVDMVRELLPRIERLSGLDRVAVLRIRYQDRDAARRYVQDRLDTEMPPERLDGVRRSYVALGLLADTLDLRSLLLDLYTEQVLGYYDPGTETLYIIQGEELESLRPVVAHELVHALQDQHTNLDSLVAQERGNDRQTAAHAALEGHAMVVMFAVLAEAATRRTVDPAALPNPADELGPALSAQTEQFPVFRRAPRIIRETLLFPYISGSDFVWQLWRSLEGLDRYPAPLDTLLPQSTAQVMRPVERFVRDRREPVELRLESVPAGWTASYENTLGQLETAIFLGQHLGPEGGASAHGWAGDRYALLTDDTGRDVLHWVSVWETEDDAARFADAVSRAAARRASRRVSVTREDIAGTTAIRIVDAPAQPGEAAQPLPRFRVVTPYD